MFRSIREEAHNFQHHLNRCDAGREGLLALLEMLGADDERVVHYRGLLAELMH